MPKTMREAEPIAARALTTRDQPGHLITRADTVNEDARTVDAVMSTETPARVFDWDSGRTVTEVLQAEGAQFRGEQVVLLDSHSRLRTQDVLGSVRNIRTDLDPATGAMRLVGTLHFARGNEAAERAWSLIREGHLTDVSVGYRVDEFEALEPGEERRINGRTYTAAANEPMRITTMWRLRELSVVPIGADEMAMIRAAHGGHQPVQPQIEERGSAMADDQITTERSDARSQVTEQSPAPAVTPEQHTTTTSTTQPAPETADQTERAIRAERKRINEIRGFALEDTEPALIERAIDEGWSVERACKAFVEAHRRGRGAPAGIVRDDDRCGPQDVMIAAISMRANGSNYRSLPVRSTSTNEYRVRDFTDRDRAQQERLAEMAERYSGLSLVDICRHAVRLDGGPEPVSSEEAVRTALAGCYTHRSGFSGGNLAVIFTTSMNAMLQQAYDASPDSTLGWTRTTSVRNFLLNERPLAGKGSAMQRLAPNGTADHDVWEAAEETYKAYRYAKQFKVDEQALINDDMNVLTMWPQEAGEAARQVRPDLVYAAMLANAALNADSVALFHTASHRNLFTTALSTANLSTALAGMAKQTQDGRTLNLRASHLIVPPDLEGIALQCVNSFEVRNTGDGAGNEEFGTVNPIRGRGLNNVVVENRLGSAGVTDPITGTVYAGSANDWYLAAAQRAAIEVGYVNGQATPRIRQYVLDKGQYGLCWDVNLDVGVCVLDYRSISKSTGGS